MWRMLNRMTGCTKKSSVMLDEELSGFLSIEKGAPQGCNAHNIQQCFGGHQRYIESCGGRRGRGGSRR